MGSSFNPCLGVDIDTQLTGIRAVVRNGWELLAVILGGMDCNSTAVELLRNQGAVQDELASVFPVARLDYRIPLAIMPCSNVSGLTARLIYGDPGDVVCRIHGRPSLCVQNGVIHLQQLVSGYRELTSSALLVPEAVD